METQHNTSNDHHSDAPERLNDTRERLTRRVAPAIYVASLADYTNGRLHGEWLDPTQELDDLYAAVTRMLGQSREPAAEEFAIHDYEGFYDFRVGEYERLETVHQIACGIAEHGEAYAAYVDVVGTEDATLDGFTDTHFGTFESIDNLIDSYLDAAGWDDELDHIRQRSPLGAFIILDTDSLRDELNTSFTIIEGTDGIHVFQP